MQQLGTPAATAGTLVTLAVFGVSLFFACGGGGCAAVDMPPAEVTAEEFPLALLLIDTRLEGAIRADGLALEVCSAQLTMRNDAPVPVGGVAIAGVTIYRAAGGEPVLSLGAVGDAPPEIGPSSQAFVPLEAGGIGALGATCGEALLLEATVVANGVATAVRGHTAYVACP